MLGLQMLSIVLEGAVAVLGVMLAGRKNKPYGWGLALTYLIYVVYDIARLTMRSPLPEALLHGMFFVATVSMLSAVVRMYLDNK
ncbi:MAG TPA: hypothetical protein PLL10_02075 [Elusimicrobiales bacterium]|nr:hypothetical protein [Elusimicrobiales bacterium]